MKNKFFAISLIIPLFIFFSCTTTKTAGAGEVLEVLCPQDENILWNEFSPGFEVIDFFIPELNVEWACVKIDLNTKNIELTVTPDELTTGKRYRLQNIQATAAINTTPFYKRGFKLYPAGIIKLNGKTICKPEPKYAALCFSHDGKSFTAKILSSQNSELEQYGYAFGGFFSILEGGNIIEFAKYRHARTACGISDEGKTLYLFATSSTTAKDSGLTYEECAFILQQLGCTDAMEFDGGNSTGLTILGKNKIRPGMQRKVPAVLGLSVAVEEK